MTQRAFDPDTVAAPPDDGGHFGEFSIPDDGAMVRAPQRPLGPGGESSSHGPPLHGDESRTGTFGKKSFSTTLQRLFPTSGFDVPAGTAFLVVVTAVAVALAILVAGG